MLCGGERLMIDALSGDCIPRWGLGFIGLGPGGLILRAWTSLAELLRLLAPGGGMLGGR